MKLGARDYIIKERGLLKIFPKSSGGPFESMAAEKELARMERALWRSEEKFRKVFFTQPRFNQYQPAFRRNVRFREQGIRRTVGIFRKKRSSVKLPGK